MDVKATITRIDQQLKEFVLNIGLFVLWRSTHKE